MSAAKPASRRCHDADLKRQVIAACAAPGASVAQVAMSIDKLTHENAILKRLKFAAQSERFSAEQKSLLDKTLDSDLAAVAAEIEAIQPGRSAGERQQPRREKLPANLPRRDVHHEPENTSCGCGQAMQRIGEDVAETVDYQPGAFTVERHTLGARSTSAGPTTAARLARKH